MRSIISLLVRMFDMNGNLYLLMYCFVKVLYLELISFLDVDSKIFFLG